MSRALLACLRAAARCRCRASSSFPFSSGAAVLEPSAEDGTGTDYIDFPGGRVPLTPSLEFNGVTQAVRTPTYRTIDMVGNEVAGAQVPFPLDKALALRIYTNMATLQTMDTLFYEAQRQGRFSFYLTSQGEEAAVIGSAAALDMQDTVFAQYREQGVLLWRGYTLLQFSHQLFGNKLEAGKGRQMPIHYGSKDLCFQTISSPLATQMPHAVGAAYALKLQRSDKVTVVYFGEGASSEGDAHAAMNFAATLGVPCIFICRNNGYAISTPAHEQYKGDGIASRGPMYGIPSVRVDGGDARAVYNAVRQGRQMAVESCRPVLIEAMSYRSGHHSTSDDSSRYRTTEEMRSWRARDPTTRFAQWLQRQGWWSVPEEQELRRSARQQVLDAMDAAAKVEKPPVSDMFTDVYAGPLPPHLQQQYDEVLDLIKQHPELKPPDMPL